MGVADARMPEESFEAAAQRLPPEKPVGPKGGRPRTGHRVVVRLIGFVPATGCRWEDVPAGMGCSGRTAARRLRARESLGVRARLHADLPGALKRGGELDAGAVVVDGVTLRAFGGGEATGPGPVDRGRNGAEHTPMADRRGVPTAIRTAGANASDHLRIIPLVLDDPKAGGRPGRPKGLPADPSADRGCDSQATRALPRWPGVEPPIARRGTPHGGGPSKVRRVVERTIGGRKGLRRMRVRYDRPLVVGTAWATLAASVIRFSLVHDEWPAVGLVSSEPLSKTTGVLHP